MLLLHAVLWCDHGFAPFNLTFEPRVLSLTLCGEQAQYDWRFGYDAKRVKGLVDFQIYTDDLAKEMGVLPPLMKIFFQKPKLWMSIMFGPVSTDTRVARATVPVHICRW